MSRPDARLRHPADPAPVDADRRGARPDDALPAPLVWTFDGPFERCLADLEDTLRRAIVLIGDAARIALLIDLSLPAVKARVQAGDHGPNPSAEIAMQIAGRQVGAIAGVAP